MSARRQSSPAAGSSSIVGVDYYRNNSLIASASAPSQGNNVNGTWGAAWNLATPGNYRISANATDNSGAVTQVQFYHGTTLIGSATSPSLGNRNNGTWYSNWLNVPVGSYSLTARATDSAGLVTTSAAVGITVVANQPPQVTLNTSAGPYTAPASIVLSATAGDADGRVAAVRFYNGSTLIGLGALVSGTASNGTWNFNWANVTAGAYVVTAQATDNQGATVASSLMQITVNAVTTGAAPGMYFVCERRAETVVIQPK